MIEETSYIVTMQFTTVIAFSPIERDRPLTEQDAIGNAKGTLPEGWFARADAGGWEVQFRAERRVAT